MLALVEEQTTEVAPALSVCLVFQHGSLQASCQFGPVVSKEMVDGSVVEESHHKACGYLGLANKESEIQL